VSPPAGQYDGRWDAGQPVGGGGFVRSVGFGRGVLVAGGRRQAGNAVGVAVAAARAGTTRQVGAGGAGVVRVAATGLGGGMLLAWDAEARPAAARASGAEPGPAPAMHATANPPMRLRTVSAATVTVSDDGRLVVIRSLSVGGGFRRGQVRAHHTQRSRPSHSSPRG
jgi:hypothetical protein